MRERKGPDARLTFELGDAQSLPYPDGSFAQMNHFR